MSLTTLIKMAQYSADQDAAQHSYEVSQAEKRNQTLTAEETQRQADELYERVAVAVGKNANRMKHGWSSVPLKTHPECVVQAVIAKLAAKGIKAKHVYNEVRPKFDVLDIDLSTCRLV